MFTSASVAETEAAGVRVAQEVRRGEVLALAGDLGTGKTQFVRGFARGLGSPALVTSPTFTLLHEYLGGRLSIYHFDFYRLENLTALKAIGFDEYIFGNGVSIIEWADRFPSAIPANARWIRFHMISPRERTIALE